VCFGFRSAFAAFLLCHWGGRVEVARRRIRRIQKQGPSGTAVPGPDRAAYDAYLDSGGSATPLPPRIAAATAAAAAASAPGAADAAPGAADAAAFDEGFWDETGCWLLPHEDSDDELLLFSGREPLGFPYQSTMSTLLGC
jgi:predicted lipid-binding transport protein (Tim44 family)